METKKIFSVVGMSCAACAVRVDKILKMQPGVREANVNYAAANVQVVYETDICSASSLKTAIQNGGYDLLIDENRDANKEAEQINAKKYRQLKRETGGALLLGFPIIVINMFFAELPYLKYALWICSSVVIFHFGNRFFINAWKQLRHGTANMDTLVATSTGIAYLFSVFNLFFPGFWLDKGITPHLYFEAASVIIAFILLGRLLEERARQSTTTAIKKLMGLQPRTVTVLRPSGEQTIPVEEARPGDTIVIKPGERIAVDGTVTEGSSFVDESMLSGEPVPVHKHPGEKVYAGTINQKGAFRFTTEKTGADTMLSQIIQMVQEAQGSKAPVQKMTDRIAGIFVPVIMGIAVLSFLLWWIFFPAEGFTYGLLSMVTVLIIACPCALGLATPTALIVGIGKGAEQGILIKDAACLEVARKIDSIVLDKTGTITEGHPVVVNMEWREKTEKVRGILYSLERLSEHPLAEAIVKTFEKGTSPQLITEFENIPGKGIKGISDAETYYAGTEELLSGHGISLAKELKEKAEEWINNAQTVIWFANSNQALAVIGVTDKIKATSVQAIHGLQEMGLTVYMLTGDNAAAAKEIARNVNIRHYKSGIYPQEKASFIKQLQEKGRKVAMVGDGINDSAALAQADLSIAMGKGSDIAMETAMVTILSSDLTKIPETIRLSRATVKTIHQNLFWAFIYNLIGVPVAAGILYPVNGFLLNPMIGGAAMALSSISVVGNSLRLKRKKISSLLSCPQRKNTDFSNPDPINKIKSINPEGMKKTFKVEGMMCNHCRTHVENALNGIEGVKATVTLDPPQAIIEFTETEVALKELQQAVLDKAGEYQLSEI